MMQALERELLVQNIFSKSLPSIKDFDTFSWHTDCNSKIDTYKIYSSQALMIDVFGYLSLCKDKDTIINSIFNTNDNNWIIQFEYTDQTLLNEKKSTQIDVMLVSDKTIVLVECKFTEQDGGTCSQTDLIKRLNKPQCNGNFQTQINPANKIKNKCALSGKKIQYWEYIPIIYDYSEELDYTPCPFKNGNYQWMRNACFAYGLHNKTGKKVLSYICYDDADFCSIKKKFDNNYLDKINMHIRKEYHFKTITYQKIIESGIQLSHGDSIWDNLKNWVEKKEQQVLENKIKHCKK